MISIAEFDRLAYSLLGFHPLRDGGARFEKPLDIVRSLRHDCRAVQFTMKVSIRKVAHRGLSFIWIEKFYEGQGKDG